MAESESRGCVKNLEIASRRHAHEWLNTDLVPRLSKALYLHGILVELTSATFDVGLNKDDAGDSRTDDVTRAVVARKSGRI
jgi:hypothetical protein